MKYRKYAVAIDNPVEKTSSNKKHRHCAADEQALVIDLFAETDRSDDLHYADRRFGVPTCSR